MDIKELEDYVYDSLRSKAPGVVFNTLRTLHTTWATNCSMLDSLVEDAAGDPVISGAFVGLNTGALIGCNTELSVTCEMGETMTYFYIEGRA